MINQNATNMAKPLMDETEARDTYKFLNALLDDYAACKTELARAGIFKVFKTMLERIGEDHLKWIKKAVQIDTELARLKAAWPKSINQLAKILRDHGFKDLKECDNCSCGVAPDISEKQYAELYHYLYDVMTEADKRKLEKLNGENNGKEEKSTQASDQNVAVDALNKTTNETIGNVAQITEDHMKVKKSKKIPAEKSKKKA